MMKMLEIFRLEIGCQARRISTWLYFVALLALTYRVATEAYIVNARTGGYLFNGPFAIAAVTLLASLMGLPVTAALAGDAGARDAQTRMHPLVYTAPVGKGAYLGGRFLAAFALNALILAAVPIGLLLAATVPGPEAELLGPFRPAFYLGPYLLLALTNAFVTAALLFALAALGRRAMASYVGGVILLVGAMFNWTFVALKLGRWELAKLLDPLGLTVMSELSRAGTPLEKSTVPLALEGSLLANRLMWIGIALGVLALAHARFRFAHPMAGGAWTRRAQKADAPIDSAGAAVAARGAPIGVPRVPRSFGGAARARQTLAVAGDSFRAVVTGWGGLVFAGLVLLVVATGPQMMEHLGVPLVPTTEHISGYLGTPGDLLWMIAMLLTVFYAGELVWREREAGLREIADAAPVPEWVSLAGRMIGLCGVLVALQALMMAAAMAVQARAGYYHFEPGVYARILFGQQLVDYLLIALLAVAVHVVVNHKHLGHGVVLVVCGFKAFAPWLGIEHNLLVYASDPGLAYSDMRGFGPALAPFVWFKLYWAAWALLLAVAARLLWVRGTERGPRSRVRLARRRLTRPAAGAAAAAVALVLTLGGFVFYNTNVLNDYRPASHLAERDAEYERRYGRYDGVPQPQIVGTRLHVELYPSRGAVEIRGTYRLVNRSAVSIDSIHLTSGAGAETSGLRFDRPATPVLADEEMGVRIYALATPLRPGDSLRVSFRVRFRPRGFTNGGVDASVSANGTFVSPGRWMPAIGYQPGRELSGAGERRAHGLSPRPAVRSVHDAAARLDVRGAERVAFEAVVGTDPGQLALAPGRLLRTWTEGGRRYFHYATDAPIRNEYAFYSAAYAVHDGRWTPPAGAGQPVAIQIVHHPGHAWNAERMVRAVQASLDVYTRRFGPYPHGQIRLVERPGQGNSLHGSPVNMWYQEGFSLFNAADDPREIDFPFAVVAHEVAHQWWGNQLAPADVEGAAVLSESLAWYSAMGVVEQTYGDEHLRRFLGMMREMYLTPRARAGVPLLRAGDWFTAYRKGPFAMYALREYVGEAPVNAALRRLMDQHRAGAPPLPTSLDLYRELQAVTPDSLRPLLADLFEANTYWELKTDRATAHPAADAAWRVTLDVTARKVVVDSIGTETEVPMNDLVEIGLYAPAADGASGAPLYLRMHRVRSGPQRITVTVPREPARAGIDPRILLIDGEAEDNVAAVTRTAAP
ncbi:MAG TPA: M1 family aminopeptidase [Longimicrobium sp.]|nr:M1 family aminopeptidase [Longimicrobium sp.]